MTADDLANVAKGDIRLVTLRALRDRVAVEIDRTASARDVAALSQRLMDVLAQIDVLTKGQKSERTPLDEFTKRRAGRVSGSTGTARATRKA